MSGFQHTLPELGFLSFLRLEWIEKRLVLTRGVHPAIHTQLLHHPDKAESSRRHTNGADQTGLVGINLIGRTGNVVSPRRPQISDHRIQLDRWIFGTQATNLVIDIARLHWATTRTVDTQDNPFGIGILKGRAQAADNIVGTGRLLISNHAAHFDHRGMTASGRPLLHCHQRREQRQRAKDVNKGQQFEENSPASSSTLLLHACKQSLL